MEHKHTGMYKSRVLQISLILCAILVPHIEKMEKESEKSNKGSEMVSIQGMIM